MEAPNTQTFEEWQNSATGEFWGKALHLLRRFKYQKSLYHYTGLQGLLGVLQSKEIWLSSIRYMNDASELSLGHERFKEVCEKLEGIRSPGKNFRELLHILRRMGDADIQLDAFIFCLCEEKDLLSQWRGYGEGGVAIGFNAERLVKSLPTRLMLQPVTYSKYTQRAMLEVLLKIFRKHLNKLNGGRGQQSKRALLNEACNSLAMILPLIKNDAFEEEKEWRLLKTSHISQEQSEVSHRVSNGLIVPYVRLKLSGKLPIERIVVGPSAHQSLLAEGIRDILARTNESSIDVELSSTPYRAR